MTNPWTTNQTHYGPDDDHQGEPATRSGVYHNDVKNGQIPGFWVLSLSVGCDIHPLVRIVYDVAVFGSEKEAIEMAAKIDELTGENHYWHVNTAFVGKYHTPQELIELMGMEKEKSNAKARVFYDAHRPGASRIRGNLCTNP